MDNRFGLKGLEDKALHSPAVQEIGFPWRIFLFAAFLFGFTVFVFFGMKLGYGSYLVLRGKSVDKSIETLSSKISEAEQDNLTIFYSQLINLEKVVGGHNFASNVFDFLEKNTAVDVYYKNADFSIADRKMTLKGVGRGMDDVIMQLTAFEEAPEAEEVFLGSVNFEAGGVTADFSVIFKSSFFDKIF